MAKKAVHYFRLPCDCARSVISSWKSRGYVMPGLGIVSDGVQEAAASPVFSRITDKQGKSLKQGFVYFRYCPFCGRSACQEITDSLVTDDKKEDIDEGPSNS